MIVRQYAPFNLGRNTICLGKQGEINALRVEFDVSAWMAMYPDATVKLMHFAPDRTQDNPVIPTLGVEGTTRVWIVGEDDTASAGNGVIELLLIDERTGSTIKSATGYTTVLHSPSAGIEAQEAEAGYVRYDIDQSALLTDEQKAVARKNIGAGTGDGTGSGTGGITVEKDPTVPAWAKQPSKPTYTAGEVGARPNTWTPSASEVGADAAGTAAAQVGAHNVSGEAHADMRELIEDLTSRLNALADSDDETLDQLSEIVAYIKSNKALIDAVTTGKVSTSDIVNNLTTNASGKVLSAAQGVRLKALIDAIVIPDKLPNPQPLTINGQSYDGSAKVEVNVTGEGGGANIDDTTPSSTTTYSSQKIESELTELNQANAKQDERLTTLENASGIVTVEPADGDIPKLYFTGTTPTSKSEGDVQLYMRYVSKTTRIENPVTLKVQGDSSASYPKKNFTMKVYADSSYVEKEKLRFKRWPAMNKFVLKAHWMDHSHVRNVGTAKIWSKIVASRSDYASLPEELRTSANNGATDGFTCKVFVNGVYQGLYELIVPKDKLFGQTTDVATHSIMNSEQNNQATCAFATTSPTISGNWSEELQDSMSADISTSFANFITFVAGSTDEEFVSNAETYFDVQSVIDFDIFARIFCIVDNVCKNQIFFTYDGVKWYEGAWDMDGVLGNPPTVRGFFAYDTAFQTGYVAYKDHGITNLIYERVETLFMDRFKARYTELRADILSADNIIDVYERLTDTITTFDGLLEEDYASTTGGGAFTGMPYKTENTIQQIRNFVAARLPYMDEQVEAIAPPAEEIPCTGITLDQTTLTFTSSGTQTLTATVTPNDTTDTVTWSSDDTSIASVSGGVVTAKGNGSATITATCGEYSATCSVSVSGIEESAGVTDGLILSLDSADVDATNMQWPDQSESGLVFTLSSGTPDVNDNGLLMTSCKVVGDRPITLNGELSEDVLIALTSSSPASAFCSYNQSSQSKYCDNSHIDGKLRINGYSGDTDTDVSLLPLNELVRITVVRPSSGNTLVYKNGELQGEYSRGTFDANGDFDLVIGASSWNNFPNTFGHFRIKTLRVFNRALTDGEVASLD